MCDGRLCPYCEAVWCCCECQEMRGNVSKGNCWTWSIEASGGELFVVLEKGSLREEVLSAFAGVLFNRGFYKWGNKLVFRGQRARTEAMRLPVSLEQARELGWDL